MVSTPTVYFQVTKDVYGEKTQDARLIGLLDPNRTILNVQSALTNSDKADIYRYRQTKDGPVGISLTTADKDGNPVANGGRVELLNRGGKVIADSAAKSGTLKDAWDQIVQTNYDGKPGDYYVRVTRAPDVASGKILQFNLQIRSTFEPRDDFTTIEKPATSITTQTYGSNGTVTTLAANIKSALTPYEAESSSQKLLSSLAPTFA